MRSKQGWSPSSSGTKAMSRKPRASSACGDPRSTKSCDAWGWIRSASVNEESRMKRIAVLTSGGDAPGMNAALRTIAKVSALRSISVIGFEDGYDGLIDGRARELTIAGAGGNLRTSSELAQVGNQGGTWL